VAATFVPRPRPATAVERPAWRAPTEVRLVGGLGEPARLAAGFAAPDLEALVFAVPDLAAPADAAVRPVRLVPLLPSRDDFAEDFPAGLAAGLPEEVRRTPAARRAPEPVDFFDGPRDERRDSLMTSPGPARDGRARAQRCPAPQYDHVPLHGGMPRRRSTQGVHELCGAAHTGCTDRHRTLTSSSADPLRRPRFMPSARAQPGIEQGTHRAPPQAGALLR